MKGVIAVLLLIPLVSAAYPYVNYSERVSLPHLYPGQSVTSQANWMLEPLNVKSSTVRWTPRGAYAIHLDKVHLEREEYTLIIKSKWGPEIRFVDFDEMSILLGNERYTMKFDEKVYTFWLDRYPTS